MTSKTTNNNRKTSNTDWASTACSGSGTNVLPEKKTISADEREAILAVFGYFGTAKIARSFHPEWYVPTEGCPSVAAGYGVDTLFTVLAASAATNSAWTLLEYFENDGVLWEECREAAGLLGLTLPAKPPTADVLLDLADSIADSYIDVLTPLTRELALTAANHAYYLRDLSPSAGAAAEFDELGFIGLGRLACVTFAELNMSPCGSTVFCGEPSPGTPERPRYRPTIDGAASALLRSLALHTEHGRVVLMLGAPAILWDPYEDAAFDDQLAVCDIDTVAVRRTTVGPDGPLDHDSWRAVDDEELSPVAELPWHDSSTISNALDGAEDLWFDVDCTELRRLTLSADDDNIGDFHSLRRGFVTVLLYALSQNALTWARACRDGEWDFAE